MFLYVSWLRKGSSIKYATFRDGGLSKCVDLRTGVGSVTPYVYVRTCTISFHIFGSIFCHILFVEIYRYLYSKKMCSSKTAIFL